ncbi:hypothetical protein WJX79_011038 [Trebouxia sp. C0005]
MEHLSAEEKAFEAKWVELAYDQALKSEAAGGIPIGSILVHQPTRKVIAAGHNQRMQKNSNILHGEMDCFENAGRTYEGRPIPWHETVCVTTLSPCLMCTGAILMYGIPAVIIAEHDNYLSPGEELLASNGVKLRVLYWVSQKRCFQQVRGTVVGPSVPVEPQVSCEYCMEPHLEDGELDVEDGEVAAGGTAQARRLVVPTPPASPVHEESVVQRKPKKPKLAKAAALGYHDVYGTQARAEVQMHTPSTIRIRDVQGLLLWVLADGMSPRWCFVKNKALVSKIVMIAIPGLEAELFTAKQEFVPIMHSQLATPATVMAKNAQVTTGSTLATLFTVPLSKKRKRESDQQQQQQKRQAQDGTHKPFPPSHYRVTLQQLESNDYPMPVLDKQGNMTCPAAYVATQPAGGKDLLEMVSVDCEMCVTAAGYELTRVSLVDGNGQVLLDELVLPENAITDYNTQYSGITAQALASITIKLTDIQRQVCNFVSAETLLVGHGLENDLKALKIIHANCLDTVMLFPHPKGPPAKPALRFLADRYLKRKIQVAEHDSVIDARAALDLVKLKIAKGPAYGTVSQHEEQGDRLMDVLHAHNRRCTLIDRTDMLNRHVTAGASAVVVKEDGEAVCKACKEAANEKTDFDCNSDTAPAEQEAPSAQSAPAASLTPVASAQPQSQDFSEEQLNRVLKTLDESVGQVIEALPVNAMLVLYTCQGDTVQCRMMQEQKMKRQQGVDNLPPWTLVDENEFSSLASRVCRALCFASVKQ